RCQWPRMSAPAVLAASQATLINSWASISTILIFANPTVLWYLMAREDSSTCKNQLDFACGWQTGGWLPFAGYHYAAGVALRRSGDSQDSRWTGARRCAHD